MTTEKGLLLTNLHIIHADENFGAEIKESSDKKKSFERDVEFSFDETEVSNICKWLGIWFSSVTERKTNHIKITDIMERGYRDMEISLSYNNYEFFSESVRFDNEVVEKIKKIIK